MNVRAAASNQNREQFPDTTEALEQLRSVFGPGVSVLYASENGRTVGRPCADRWPHLLTEKEASDPRPREEIIRSRVHE